LVEFDEVPNFLEERNRAAAFSVFVFLLFWFWVFFFLNLKRVTGFSEPHQV
jgi:hypothetical protein